MQRRVLRYSIVNFALAGRQNLNPLTLGVGDKIKGHARVLANNATHLFMKLMGGVKVVHDEGDMGVFATILLGLNAPTVPGELDFEGHAVVAHERIGPRAIARTNGKTQSPIKRKEQEGRQPKLTGHAKATLAKCARRSLEHRRKCPLLFQRGQTIETRHTPAFPFSAHLTQKKTIATEAPVSHKQLFCYHCYVLYA